MEGEIRFSFEGVDHSATYLVCQEKFPTYIYISFKDPGLVRRFGEEICIHSEGINLMTNNIHTDKRLELFGIVFRQMRKLVALKQNLKKLSIFNTTT